MQHHRNGECSGSVLDIMGIGRVGSVLKWRAVALGMGSVVAQLECIM